MNGELNLYNVNDSIAKKALENIATFNIGRREDSGFYAISMATAVRPNFSLWRIFPLKDISPLFIQTLAINIDDALQRAIKYLRNCNITLKFLDNTYFETYYGISEDIIAFGKYSGKRLSEIYYVDPGYVLWLANKFEARNKRDEKLITLARMFSRVYFETVIHKKDIPSASKYIGVQGEKLDNLKLTVLTVRLQVDQYKPDYFVDQKVLATDVDGNRFSFLVKAVGKSPNPYVLSCYSHPIIMQQNLFIKSAKVLSHYENKGIRYTRIGYLKFA